MIDAISTASEWASEQLKSHDHSEEAGLLTQVRELEQQPPAGNRAEQRANESQRMAENKIVATLYIFDGDKNLTVEANTSAKDKSSEPESMTARGGAVNSLTLADRALFPTDRDGRHYSGEKIQRDIPPGSHTVLPGETLHAIARAWMGAGTSADNVNRYVEELKKVNHLDNAQVIPGQMLNLPGHSADGSRFIVKDAEGNKRIIYPNGSFELEMKDGSQHSRFYNNDGSYQEYRKSADTAAEWKMTSRSASNPADKDKYQEVHGGSEAEDNYVLERTSTGYKIKDQHGDKTVGKYDDGAPDIRVEKARLKDLAEKNLADPSELKQFEEDLARFDARSKLLEQKYKKQLEAQGRSPEDATREAHTKAQAEAARTYHELSRLMAKEELEKPGLSTSTGPEIATRTLYHLADPTTIDQGPHPTCQTATVQARMFTNDPSKAAKLIADICIGGKYTTPDGKTSVELEQMALELGPRALVAADPSLGYPPRDNHLSLVSYVFQWTAINTVLNRTGLLNGDGSVRFAPGTVRYEHREPDVGTKPPDNGERLVDISDRDKPRVLTVKDLNGKERPIKSPSLTDDQITDMYNALTNRKDTAAVLVVPESIYGEGKRVKKIETAEALNKALHEAKEMGELPIIVAIHTRKSPFWEDSEGSRAGGSGGGHVVTITDYHPAELGPPAKPARVDVDNQWGKKADHTGTNAMKVSDLFLAMLQPKRNGKK